MLFGNIERFVPVASKTKIYISIELKFNAIRPIRRSSRIVHAHQSFARIETIHHTTIVFAQCKIKNINILFNSFFSHWLRYRNNTQFDLSEKIKVCVIDINFKWFRSHFHSPNIWVRFVRSFYCICQRCVWHDRRTCKTVCGREDSDVPVDRNPWPQYFSLCRI